MNESYVLAFGPFELSFPQRTLSRGDEEVRLGSRAIEILIALAEARGDLVSNRTLFGRVWPDSVVDEGSLRVHLSALRKALDEAGDGTRYIANETGRGYRLAVAVTRRAEQLASSAIVESTNAEPLNGMPVRSTLPVVLGRIVGRDSVIQGLCELLPERRLMTIAGAGGIGKTTVAVSIAHQFQANNLGVVDAYFVDFAPVTDPSRVASTVALRLAVPVSTQDPVPDLLAAIGRGRMLLVFDNCEHLVEAIAELAERLLQGASDLRILATSREPLRAESEWVHRLAPLSVPEMSSELCATQGLMFPAVALFVERASAANHGFTFSEENVQAVCEICRRLDGIPLAIEMAAARVASMDVQSLAAGLNDRFALLTRGRRTALPRQQTLRAMLDWSYALLERRTQTILQRLAIFRSSFDVAAAVAVAVSDEVDDLSVFDATADLVAKSLLTSEQAGSDTMYRLLETTRHYALDRLMESDGHHAARTRHAEYCVGLFENPFQAWERNARRELTVRHSNRLDDIRYAFDWAASPEGDAILAIRLATVSSPLWFQLSLPLEFMKLAERVIAAVPEANLEGAVEQLELLTAYGHAIWHTRGPIQEMADTFNKSLRLARTVGDADFEMRSVWGLWSQKLQSGEYATSLQLALEYEQLAIASPRSAATQNIRHTQALSYERLGELSRARDLIEAVIADDTRNPVRAGYANAAQLDGSVAAWTLLMRLHWLQGFGSKASALAHKAVEDALTIGHDLSICYCISMGALPVAVWTGDAEFARDLLKILRSRTKRNGLLFWDRWADGYEAVIYELVFDPSEATTYQKEVFATMGCRTSLIDLAQRGHLRHSSWCQAELLRRDAAEQLSDSQEREQTFARAMAIANGQGASAWNLRAALSIARLKRESGEREYAKSLVESAAKAFSEGFETRDMQEAQEILLT